MFSNFGNYYMMQLCGIAVILKVAENIWKMHIYTIKPSLIETSYVHKLAKGGRNGR